MENLLLSFGVVTPLLIYMAVGVLLRACGIVDERICRGANSIVFYVSLPALCYEKIAKSDLAGMVDTPFLLYLGTGVLLVFAFAVLIVPRFCRDDRRRGVLVMSIFRSNGAIFGLSVAAALLGSDRLTLMALAVALTIPIFNLLSVVVLERYRDGKVALGRIVLRIFKNPILLGCIAGFLGNLLHVDLPAVLQKPLDGAASLTTPLAFIALGGTITFSALRRNRAALICVSLLRLVLVPVIALAAFLLMGFRGEPIVVALIVFGAPVAMTTYTMAAGVGADDELAGSAVAVTSLLSMPSMFLFIFLLKQFAFI
jgi:predicted permease